MSKELSILVSPFNQFRHRYRRIVEVCRTGCKVPQPPSKEVLRPGGVLVTCSSRAENFDSVILRTKRPLVSLQDNTRCGSQAFRQKELNLQTPGLSSPMTTKTKQMFFQYKPTQYAIVRRKQIDNNPF